MGIYNANWRVIDASDTYSSRFLPFADTLGLSHLIHGEDRERRFPRGRTHPYWIITEPATDASCPAIRLSRLSSSLPLYVHSRDDLARYMHGAGPTIAWIGWRGSWKKSPHRWSPVSPWRYAVSGVAQARTISTPRSSFSIAYAFGTNIWGISSQGLWQHGMAGLLLAIDAPSLLQALALSRALCCGISVRSHSI